MMHRTKSEWIKQHRGALRIIVLSVMSNNSDRKFNFLTGGVLSSELKCLYLSCFWIDRYY